MELFAIASNAWPTTRQRRRWNNLWDSTFRHTGRLPSSTVMNRQMITFNSSLCQSSQIAQMAWRKAVTDTLIDTIFAQDHTADTMTGAIRWRGWLAGGTLTK